MIHALEPQPGDGLEGPLGHRGAPPFELGLARDTAIDDLGPRWRKGGGVGCSETPEDGEGHRE